MFLMLSKLAQKLKFSRHQKGLTQEQVAKKVRVGRTSVVNWETDYARPSPEQLEKLSEVLEVEKTWLLKNDEFNYLSDEKEAKQKSTTEFGKKLILLRKSKGLTLKDIGNILNMSTTGYHKYEKGITEPNLESLVILARFYNISLDDLLDVNNDSAEPINSLDYGIEDWIIEIANARGNKKEAIKNIWKEIKDL